MLSRDRAFSTLHIRLRAALSDIFPKPRFGDGTNCFFVGDIAGTCVSISRHVLSNHKNPQKVSFAILYGLSVIVDITKLCASISILKAPLPLPQSTEFTGEVWAPITHGQSDTPHRNTGALFHAQPLVLCAVRHGRLVSSVCSAHNAYIFIRVQRAPFALRAACASQPVSFC
ncbi:hypothetical protein TEA_016366 [Camellia sinensis var. sinensis]|uniref:Uncharacterized protein n=1 Tax=Camellia sinensis var. sinensis TaxID=542762 RepID=A0A4S4DAI3_CAMSN|nr:hypothetical protein TEA_016366 [Camellia sinensis var. sinensis]